MYSMLLQVHNSLGTVLPSTADLMIDFWNSDPPLHRSSNSNGLWDALQTLSVLVVSNPTAAIAEQLDHSQQEGVCLLGYEGELSPHKSSRDFGQLHLPKTTPDI
jgi:hypothetical protein